MADTVHTAHSSLWTPPAGAGGELLQGADDRFPLSLQQEFLGLVDTGDEVGPFSARYTIAGAWRLTGPLDVETLQAALDDVVARHEALRTLLIRTGDLSYQQVFPASTASPAGLQVRDLSATDPDARDRRADELLDEIEAGTFEMEQLPQLGAVLGRFDDRDAVLVLVAHHTAVDGWSIQLIVRDLAAYYTARRAGRPAGLTDPGQYRQYVAWQRARADTPAATAAREFWRRNLQGAQITPIATDIARSAQVVPATAYHRFLLPEQRRSATRQLAKATRSSPFMVLLAAYTVLLRRSSGLTDIVAATFTPGRHPAWVLDTVGSFYDFVPLRIDLAGCATARELIDRIRRVCLAAYAHEIPFLEIMNEAPDLMEPAAAERAACCVFQVVQSPHIMADELVGELRYTAMRRRLKSQPIGSAVPDGALWSLELHQPGIVGSVGYTTNLFTEPTIETMVADFDQVLGDLLADPDQRLSYH
jgi:hypothetical protein